MIPPAAAPHGPNAAPVAAPLAAPPAVPLSLLMGCLNQIVRQIPRSYQPKRGLRCPNIRSAIGGAGRRRAKSPERQPPCLPMGQVQSRLADRTALGSLGS